MSLGLFHRTAFIFSFCLVFACQGSDENIVDGPPRNSAGICDVKVEDFILNHGSADLLPYNLFNEVQFRNEEGEILIFSISSPIESRFEGIFQASDSLDICYATESSETKLISTDGIELTFLTEPKAYYADLMSSQHADVLKVYYNNTNDTNTDRRIVFRKVIDMHSYPPPLYQTTTVIDSHYFIDKEFKNIELTQFNTPIIKLYYNDETGIVAFIDEHGILWQFDNKS